MFEDQLNRTPQEILKDILSRLDDVDTRPSSANYQSISAISYELRNIALMLLWGINQTFIKTADGHYLDMIGGQFNFIREKAKTVIVKAEIISDDVIPLGNRFASVGIADSIIYKVIEYIGNNIYYLQAEELKEQANYYIGDIAMIDFISNISKAQIKEVVFPQKEEESDEEFRERIQNNLIAEATDGNVAQYKKWLSEIEDVGKSKVTSLWNGANTVKCTILNEENQSASTELIKKVQDILDPNSEGLGEGKAPIGAIVTVDTAEELTININVQVEYKTGKTSAPTLKKELNKFFSDIAFNRSVVSYLQVASVISNNENIDFITDLTINEGKTDVQLNANQIPVLGDLNVN